MGARFRQRRDQAVDPTTLPSEATSSDVVAGWAGWDTSPDVLQATQIGTTVYAPMFGAPAELQHVMAQQRQPTDAGYMPAVVDVKDHIQYDVGGQRGNVDAVPYGLGVVSSDAVENFALTGEQAIIRRPGSKQDSGPVGTSDHNAMLALAFAQQANSFYPNERSQANLIANL